MSILKVENLSIKYFDEYVFKDLSFTIDEGDYLCILGKNGSGKSTLVKTILGLIETNEGKIIFSDDFEQNEIGYLPQQNIYQKDFPATVKEIVLSGCLNKLNKRFFYNTHEKALANENMHKLNIYDLKDKSFHNLSGGQQQRILLARALCASKKLLLLDEPVSGLDINVTKDLYKIIKELNDEGLTIIMISHDYKEAIKYANKILEIDDNIFFGKTKDYLNRKDNNNA